MIEIKHLSKTFQMKDGAVNALSDINLTIPDGSIYGIIGMSGAGKSTLVRCINLLERPTEGSVVIDGVEMEKLSPAELRARRREITMIFQQFNLLMQRSCLKNICFPMELAGVKKRTRLKSVPASCWSWSACLIRPKLTRPSFPAARSSASPLPAHWRPSQKFCSVTRPPAHWTPTPPTPS